MITLEWEKMNKDNFDLLNQTSDSASAALGENENVLWQSKPRPFAIVFRKLIVVIILTAAICFMEIILIKATLASKDMYTYIKIFISIFLSLPILIVARYYIYIISTYKKYKNTEYLITDKRLIIKSNKITSIEFHQITSIYSFSTPLEKLLGVGNVTVYAFGLMHMIECIQYPLDVRLKLQEMLQTNENTTEQEKSMEKFVGGDFYKIKEKTREDFMSKVDEDFGADKTAENNDTNEKF